MDVTPIKTDQEHNAALQEIERLWGAKDGTEDSDRLDVLATLVEAYEAKRWPVAGINPVDTTMMD